MLTAEQKQARKQYIGSSDVAAILGCDPYRSASDVYLDKTGQCEDFEGNKATDRGVRLEPVLLDWCESQIGQEILRDQMVPHANGILCTNFDGLVNDEESVEAKTTIIDAGWGEVGTDQVPDRVQIQVHTGFACKPTLKLCHVPVLLPGFRQLDFRLYCVRRDDKLVEIIEREAETFMEQHVRLGIPPENYRPSIEVLKRVRRVPAKTIELPDEVVDAWQKRKAAEKQAKDGREEAEAKLLAALGNAEGGTYSGGLVTFLEYRNKGYAVKPYTYRSLRIKTDKKGAER